MKTPLYSLRIGAGAIHIRKDLTQYRLVDTGWWVAFDESSPPEVDPNTVIAILPRFTNEGLAAVNYTLEGSVTGPGGTPVPVTWYLDPAHARPLDPGSTAGIGFEFTAAAPGDYTMAYRVFADGMLSDSWQPVVCRVSATPPEEPGEEPGEEPPEEEPPEEEPPAGATRRMWPFAAVGTLALAGIGVLLWRKR